MVGSDFVEDKEYKVKLNITIDRDIKELLQQEAKAERLSVSAYITRLVMKASAEKYKDKLFL